MRSHRNPEMQRTRRSADVNLAENSAPAWRLDVAKLRPLWANGNHNRVKGIKPSEKPPVFLACWYVLAEIESVRGLNAVPNSLKKGSNRRSSFNSLGTGSLISSIAATMISSLWRQLHGRETTSEYPTFTASGLPLPAVLNNGTPVSTSPCVKGASGSTEIRIDIGLLVELPDGHVSLVFRTVPQGLFKLFPPILLASHGRRADAAKVRHPRENFLGLDEDEASRKQKTYVGLRRRPSLTPLTATGPAEHRAPTTIRILRRKRKMLNPLLNFGKIAPCRVRLRLRLCRAPGFSGKHWAVRESTTCDFR